MSLTTHAWKVWVDTDDHALAWCEECGALKRTEYRESATEEVYYRSVGMYADTVDVPVCVG